MTRAAISFLLLIGLLAFIWYAAERANPTDEQLNQDIVIDAALSGQATVCYPYPGPQAKPTLRQKLKEA